MITQGIYPTMITPFTPDNGLDHEGIRALVRFYLENGMDGVFAVCQSSEMFFLSLRERVELAAAVVRANTQIARELGRKPLEVVASGHISDDPLAQAEEAQAVYETGVSAFVLVTNRLDPQQEGDCAFQRNLETLLARTGDIPLGLYECPYPYKRLLSPELARFCADTGRFLFMKDTCCDLQQLTAKIQALQGTSMGLFNANAQTLLPSLRAGAAGFSGVMANFHPDLYARLYRFFQQEDPRANALADHLTYMALTERTAYPVTAKYHAGLLGLPIGLQTRVREGVLDAISCLEMQAMLRVEEDCRRLYV